MEYTIKVSKGKNIIIFIAWLLGISLYIYLGLMFWLDFQIPDDIAEKLVWWIPIISTLMIFIGLSMSEGTIKIDAKAQTPQKSKISAKTNKG